MQPLVAGANGLNGIDPNPVVAGESGATSARQAATDDVSTGPLARSSEAVKYQVAGSMQIRYASGRKGSKYFIALTTERRLGASCENAAR